jgi:hypothetical protein
MARGLTSRIPGKSHYQMDARGRALVREAVRRSSFDLMILNGADLLPLLDLLPRGVGRVLLSHNIETDVIAPADRRACAGLATPPAWPRDRQDQAGRGSGRP